MKTDPMTWVRRILLVVVIQTSLLTAAAIYVGFEYVRLRLAMAEVASDIREAWE